MKYQPGHKEATRQRIVESATRHFRERGLRGASLPAIMRDADLTVGGFYRHFESKDELFRTALEKAMGDTASMLQARAGKAHGSAWVEKAAALYLHPAHRENVAGGCPLPILTPEVARSDEATKAAFGESLVQMADEVAEQMGEEGAPASREEAWGFLAVLVGGLLLSRGVDDSLSEEILAASRKAAGRL